MAYLILVTLFNTVFTILNQLCFVCLQLISCFIWLMKLIFEVNAELIGSIFVFFINFLIYISQAVVYIPACLLLLRDVFYEFLGVLSYCSFIPEKICILIYSIFYSLLELVYNILIVTTSQLMILFTLILRLIIISIQYGFSVLHMCLLNSHLNGYLYSVMQGVIAISIVFFLHYFKCVNMVVSLTSGYLQRGTDIIQRRRRPRPRPNVNNERNLQIEFKEGIIASQKLHLDESTGSADSKEATHLQHCVICLDEPKSVLLLPCRHLCLCLNCVEQVLHMELDQGACPLCRHLIDSYLEVYI